MPVLAQCRVTNSAARIPSTMQMLTKIIVISAMVVSAHAAQHITMTSPTATNESDSGLVAASRTSAASAWPWTQFFSEFSWPTIFGEQQHDAGETGESDEGSLSRTFGLNRLKKKLAIGMLPVMFKLGIMVMVVFAILLMSIKGVFIGTTLLIINLGFVLAKIIAWKKHSEHSGYIEHPGWSQQYSGGKQNNDIHVHIHNPAPVSYSSPPHDLPYSGYAPQQNRGPSIHIEPAPYSAGGNSDGWASNQRRQLQYGSDYVDSNGGNYQAQAKPQYVPTNQWP